MSAPTNTPTPFDADRSGGLDSAAEGEHALARAKLGRALAALFCDGGETIPARLNRPAVRAEIEAAAERLGLPAAMVSAVFDRPGDLTEHVEALQRLGGHAVRSECPPYELEYQRGEVFHQSQTLADIAGFYAAFGLACTGPLAERPDHFVAQLEFLSILAQREALALERGDAEGIDCCRRAQASFLCDHAGRWMPAYLARVRRAAPESTAAAAADLGEAVLRTWCDRFNTPPGPAWIELRPVDEEDATITCGAPDAAEVELGPTLAAAMEGSVSV